MRATYLFVLCLMLCIFQEPRAAAASEPRLEGSTVSASGIHAMLYVLSSEANRSRDVIVRFDTPIFPKYVELSLGALISHDDGRESYVETSRSLPFAFERDAQEATRELHISSNHQLYTPAHQIAMKVVFTRELEGSVEPAATKESVVFSFAEPLCMF